MMRTIAHLMKVSLISSLFSLLPRGQHYFTSFASFRRWVGPPRVTGHQRQPAGVYFSYLTDLYFGGLRGMQ